MTGFLTWWQGGLLLAAIAVTFQLLVRKGLGVSGSWARFTFWRETRKQYQAQKHFTDNTDINNDFRRMTLEQFGEEALSEPTPEPTTPQPREQTSQHVSWGVHCVFLLSIITGAFLVSLYDGTFTIQFELSAFHTQLSGQGWPLINALFVGGILVGFGTQMAGGCTSGHGLSGCANFSLASFVATATVIISASLLALLARLIAT